MFLYLKSILEYIFPSRCIACYSMDIIENALCSKCWNRLHFISKPYCNMCGYIFSLTLESDQKCIKCIMNPKSYDIARSLFIFDENSKKIIHAFKYYDKTQLADFFANLIIQRYGIELADVDFIIPIPMHRLKRLVRMYNAAQILAKSVSNILGKPLLHNCLIKARWSVSQTSLKYKQRQQNIKGTLIIKNFDQLINRTVLLVDDVKTTGATLNECAQLLKSHGVKVVKFVSIACS